jgi:hypothetical protein
MEEEKPNTSSPQQSHANSCSNPGIKKDAEFIMEHLNDPNFDLSWLPSSVSVAEEEVTKRYIGKDSNGAIDLDKWALFCPFLLFHLSYNMT